MYTKFDKLTKSQRQPLFDLVNKQEEYDFELQFKFISPIEYIICHDGNFEFQTIVKIKHEVFNLWKNNQYISSAEVDSVSDSKVQLFVICQKAIDYKNICRYPKWLQRIIFFFQKLLDESPSLIFGALGGTISGVLTIIILNHLGLIK